MWNDIWTNKLACKEWWKAACARAIATIAQAAIASIGTATILEQVDWKVVLSASILSGILSLFFSVARNLPELED